jgi:hypothetical protein
MDMDALVLAHTQRRGVNETDASAFSQKYLLDKDGERYDRLLLQFHEAVVGDNLREQVAKVHADLIQIEMLQATVARIVEQYHNGHNLGNGEPSCPMAKPLSCHFGGIETIFV